MKNIIIIGGDKRQEELNRLLLVEGYRCIYINSCEKSKTDLKISDNDAVILPVPVTKDKETVFSSNGIFSYKLNEILSLLNKTNLVFGGGFPEEVKDYLAEKHISYFDYLESEEFTLYNAYLTGLGAVRLLNGSSGGDVRGKKVLVTGFGRVAKFTAQSLIREGCDIYVSARNNIQLTEAECIGYKTFELGKISSFLYIFDYVFNTVPHNIFSFEDINHFRGKYFELASAPYGVNREYFAGRDTDYIDGGSLPGRFLYLSAAKRLAKLTLKHINSRNGGD